MLYLLLIVLISEHPLSRKYFMQESTVIVDGNIEGASFFKLKYMQQSSGKHMNVREANIDG